MIGVSGCLNPAIYRARGTVVSVRAVDSKSAEVCLERAVKAAGSTYGTSPSNGRICMDGIAEPPALPNIGDCVVLQQQGEGSVMKIEPADECA
jgi:hypothetical protein